MVAAVAASESTNAVSVVSDMCAMGLKGFKPGFKQEREPGDAGRGQRRDVHDPGCRSSFLDISG